MRRSKRNVVVFSGLLCRCPVYKMRTYLVIGNQRQITRVCTVSCARDVDFQRCLASVTVYVTGDFPFCDVQPTRRAVADECPPAESTSIADEYSRRVPSKTTRTIGAILTSIPVDAHDSSLQKARLTMNLYWLLFLQVLMSLKENHSVRERMI
ncbi:hypothetical protein DPMN_169257 [Dreissena polymorpha]|uniref:Uncharacterized protein n=1 Tax=Dreissena polymorpha TaxID=45954 RepID=A0A9D4IWN8_DREPO|nr:hypothetical protein DPMN_169257 [Dreissena polymorpha]